MWPNMLHGYGHRQRREGNGMVAGNLSRRHDHRRSTGYSFVGDGPRDAFEVRNDAIRG
jgi:hypothetical protein